MSLRPDTITPSLVALADEPRSLQTDGRLFEAFGGAQDVVRFLPGVSPDALQVQRATASLPDGSESDVLSISWGGAGGIRVAFDESATLKGVGIERFEFSDGTVMTFAQMLARASNPQGMQVQGTGGADVLHGGAGNDVLAGGPGADVYLFGRGDGQDTVIENNTAHGSQLQDIVRFGEGIDPNQLWFFQTGNDLDVRLGGTSDRLRIQDWSLDPAHRIGAFELSDGRRLLEQDVSLLVQAMAGFAPVAMTGMQPMGLLPDSIAPLLAAHWS